jgi:predicted transposase YdaD
MDMTWAGKLKAEGRTEGRQKGRTEGMQHLLLRQAQRRFGPLPEEMQKRLLAVEDTDELNRLSDRLLEARSLQELGLTA